MPSPFVLGILISLLAALLWGAAYASTQVLVTRGIPSSTLLFSSYFLGAIIFTCVSLLFDRPNAYKQYQNILAIKHEYTRFVFAMLLAELLIFYSIALLGGTEAGLVEVSYPLWTALVLFVVKGERPNMFTWIGGALIMTGVIVVATHP